LCDKLSDGLSLVYSYYDPDLRDRSLGSYIILEHIEHAKRLKLPYVYLGYWIEGSRKMAYKSRFMPQERLTRNGWVRVSDNGENTKSG
jgi:arginine-tRNA-protein transferase